MLILEHYVCREEVVVFVYYIPPKQRYFQSVYSSMPWWEPSRPRPDSLTPPKAAYKVQRNRVLVCSTSRLWVPPRTRNSLFSFFFQFLIYPREMGDEKWEIDFLHFLSIFGQIFEDFLKFHNVVRAFHFKKWQKMKKSLV